MDTATFLSNLPLMLRQAVIDQLPEGCRPEYCDDSCIKTYFCNEDEAYPLTEECPRSVIVTFQGFGRDLDRSNCVSQRYINFHVRYITGCFPIDAQGCDIDEAVSSTIVCGYYLECAIGRITPQQLGFDPGVGDGTCTTVAITSGMKCLLEGGCAGFETTVRIYI